MRRLTCWTSGMGRGVYGTFISGATDRKGSRRGQATGPRLAEKADPALNFREGPDWRIDHEIREVAPRNHRGQRHVSSNSPNWVNPLAFCDLRKTRMFDL